MHVANGQAVVRGFPPAGPRRGQALGQLQDALRLAGSAATLGIVAVPAREAAVCDRLVQLRRQDGLDATTPSQS